MEKFKVGDTFRGNRCRMSIIEKRCEGVYVVEIIDGIWFTGSNIYCAGAILTFSEDRIPDYFWPDTEIGDILYAKD